MSTHFLEDFQQTVIKEAFQESNALQSGNSIISLFPSQPVTYVIKKFLLPFLPYFLSCFIHPNLSLLAHVNRCIKQGKCIYPVNKQLKSFQSLSIVLASCLNTLSYLFSVSTDEITWLFQCPNNLQVQEVEKIFFCLKLLKIAQKVKICKQNFWVH